MRRLSTLLLLVACGPDNYLAVIDLATMAMTGKRDVGGEPDGMAWAVRR